MRKPFVVLIPICIRAVLGFIVPTFNPPITLMTRISQFDDEYKPTTVKLKMTEGVRMNNKLPSDRKNIDESALYEHAANKQNNQSERAFIYINQRYKKPSLHQYFKLAQNGPQLSRSFHLPPPIPQANIQRLNEPCKSVPEHISAYFQGSGITVAAKPDIASYFASPSYDCNTQNVNNIRGNNYRDNKNNYNVNKMANAQQRDFIELLKSPILRPTKKYNEKAKYDGIPGLSFSPHSNNDLFKLQQQLKNQYNFKGNILVDERKSEMRKSYGFNPTLNHQSGYQSKGIVQKVDDHHFEGEFPNDEEHSRPFEISQDEDKLLDQYLKDTLEDQVTSKEKTIITSECGYHDCHLPSQKTSSSVGHRKDVKKPECKCGVQSVLHKNEADIGKERPEREGTKCTKGENTLKPSDIAYYEEVLTDDSSKTKTTLDHNLINMLNKSAYR